MQESGDDLDVRTEREWRTTMRVFRETPIDLQEFQTYTLVRLTRYVSFFFWVAMITLVLYLVSFLLFAVFGSVSSVG